MQKTVRAAQGDKQGERGRSSGSGWNCVGRETGGRLRGAFFRTGLCNRSHTMAIGRRANEERLKAALLYAAWALKTPAGRERNRDGVLFKAPAKLDFCIFCRRIPTTSLAILFIGCIIYDAGKVLRSPIREPIWWGALDEANYCIWCHEQGKDSCSKGIKEKPKTPEKGPSSKRASWVSC